MNKLFFVALALLCLCEPVFAWDSYVGKTINARVEEIKPGAVILARADNGDELSVRFYGIGTPKENQPFGDAAREALLRLLPKGAKIVITSVNDDGEGIISALVQHDDHSVNNRLIDEGLAWVDRRECKAFFCRRWHIQEHLAVKDRRGVWSLNLSSPPWQWGD